ncbi:MAG: hypothetical protein HY329_27070 [Chloroflexi bacterium]|nr:hypothetical protein [Chloroflexota bacterium]
MSTPSTAEQAGTFIGDRPAGDSPLEPTGRSDRCDVLAATLFTARLVDPSFETRHLPTAITLIGPAASELTASRFPTAVLLSPTDYRLFLQVFLCYRPSGNELEE